MVNCTELESTIAFSNHAERSSWAMGLGSLSSVLAVLKSFRQTVYSGIRSLLNGPSDTFSPSILTMGRDASSTFELPAESQANSWRFPIHVELYRSVK